MTKHSINIQNLFVKFGLDKLPILKITDWTPMDENGVAFRINKSDFVGTFNVFKTDSENFYEVLFQEDCWIMTAGTYLKGEDLIDFLTGLTGFGKKEEPKKADMWEAGNGRNLVRGEGERAPIEMNLPMSAN